MKRLAQAALLATGAVLAGAAAPAHDDRITALLRPATDFTRAETYEAMSAGAATSTKRVNADSFSHGSANLTLEQELDFRVGNGFFRRLWVAAPASTQSADGLGPLFNARSCQRCHLKDGRGHPPAANWPDDDAVSMFLRLSVPPETEEQKRLIADLRTPVIPEPTYGGQLQDFALVGMEPEGRMQITYTPLPVTLGDGTVVELRKPAYSVIHPGYGPLHPKVMISPRVAPQMIGMGLLEMIPEADIVARADPDDRDGDGISGRAQRVWDHDAGRPALGRFGWKAGSPTVRQQSAEAFANDIGISTVMLPPPWGDCTPAQKACRTAPVGGSIEGEVVNGVAVEASEKVLGLVTFYSRNLAVPKRRKVSSPRVLAGKKLFYQSGCIACHVPKHLTGHDPKRPEHSDQLIWPYTDLLLHDMGDGLADGRPEGLADGREWRTAPLWGIGLTNAVNGHTFFLHDGRARNLLEAILWHGGEAEAAREKVRLMTKEDREALLAFLESL